MVKTKAKGFKNVITLFLCLCALVFFGIFSLLPPKEQQVKDLSLLNGKYMGGMQRGRFNGEGVFIGKDGALYRGTWQKGRFEGKGTFQSKQGWSLQGDFKLGEPQEKAILTLENGEQWILKKEEGWIRYNTAEQHPSNEKK